MQSAMTNLIHILLMSLGLPWLFLRVAGYRVGTPPARLCDLLSAALVIAFLLTVLSEIY